MPADPTSDIDNERAALIALLRGGLRPWQEYADLVEEAGSAVVVLAEEHGLLAAERTAAAREELDRWKLAGLRLLTVLDAEYPENLHAVHDRPPLIFVAGNLRAADARAVAVVGARNASPHGRRAAARIAAHLVERDYTVISGLAAGIDTTAHAAALESHGRTIAVVGTGLNRAYPPENAQLQRTIARQGAVISQFWPDAPPSRRSFPMRNAVMSGLALASVIVEASHTSGARMQARLALEHGRPVFLLAPLLSQPWAQTLARRPGAYVIHSPEEITRTVERLSSPGALTA